MTYSSLELLTVYLDAGTERRKIGRLALKDRQILFEYDTTFIASGIEISPIKLPLKSGVFVCEDKIFDGLYGVFNDSLPDGWGRLLLERAANARNATAAFLLAQTYDPAALGVRDARSTAPDPVMARDWYRTAASFGSADAQQRLAQLQN